MSTKEILETIKLANEPDLTKAIEKKHKEIEKIRMAALGEKDKTKRIALSKKLVKELDAFKEMRKHQTEIENARIRKETIDPEDLELIRENYEAREFFSPRGIKNLYMVICHH